MTEYDWLNSHNPQEMLGYIPGFGGGLSILYQRPINYKINLDRRLRLVCCFCCRKMLFQLLTRNHGTSTICLANSALQTVEEYADGLVNENELEYAHKEMNSFLITHRNHTGDVEHILIRMIHFATRMYLTPRHFVSDILSLGIELEELSTLFREVFGNPLRLDKSELYSFGRLMKIGWLTDDVLNVAKVAHSERTQKECPRCDGGRKNLEVNKEEFTKPPLTPGDLCFVCSGAGYKEDGTLLSSNLCILSDALEEAGYTY